MDDAPIVRPESDLPDVPEDGLLGLETARRLNEFLDVKVGTLPAEQILPSTVRRLQQYLNDQQVRDWDGKLLQVDGEGFSDNLSGRYPPEGISRTVYCLQRHFGVAMDGYLSSPSLTVRRLQVRLNRGTI